MTNDTPGVKTEEERLRSFLEAISWHSRTVWWCRWANAYYRVPRRSRRPPRDLGSQGRDVGGSRRRLRLHVAEDTAVGRQASKASPGRSRW